MTLQEIFDKAAKHLLTQGVKSKLFDQCAYRGVDGTMCAAGPFIKDDVYSEYMEGKTVFNIVDRLQLSDFPVGNSLALVLLRALQIVHDNNDPTMWHAKLSELSRSKGLTMRTDYV